MAESGHYPAIDIEQSISRVMTQVVSQQHQQLAQQFKRTLSLYNKNRELLTLGTYKKGTDPQVDEAIRMNPAMMKLLTQSIYEGSAFEESCQQLQQLWPGVRRS